MDDYVWDDSNNILFDDIELALSMITSGYDFYGYFSERLKRDHIICHTIVEHYLDRFKYLADEVKTDINFIQSLGHDTIYSIYDYLDENIRNALINTYGITSPSLYDYRIMWQKG
jgi:F420-0:gamma-glutamyl ligase-like protein